MKKILFILTLILILPLSLACGSPEEEAISPQLIKEGQQLYTTKCNKCHEIKPIDTHVRTGWISCVERMQEKDPTWISDEEREKITAYLSASVKE